MAPKPKRIRQGLHVLYNIKENMSEENINHRFSHHPPKNPEIVQIHESVREELRATANYLDQVLPEGREKALAITKLEEALMWANAAIARA